MPRRSLIFSLLVLATVAACEDESVPASLGVTPDPLAIDFSAAPYGVSACDAANGRLMVRRELRLYTNMGHDVEQTAQALQRYFRRFGISFYRTRPAEVIDLGFVEDLDNAALNRSLRQQFPGVELTDASLTALESKDPALFNRVVRAILNFQFRGAGDFMKKFGDQGQGITNLVLLRELFTPGSPQMERQSVLGISLSPFLISELKRSGMDATGAFAQLDFPPNFTPAVFISDTNVGALAKAAGDVHRDLVLAHEFGHSAGLVHRMDVSNLMNPSTNGTETCNLQISEDQIAVMQKGLGITGGTGSSVLGRRLSDQPGDRMGDEVVPLVTPALLAGVVRGDPDAQRAFLAPFQRLHTQH